MSQNLGSGSKLGQNPGSGSKLNVFGSTTLGDLVVYFDVFLPFIPAITYLSYFNICLERGGCQGEWAAAAGAWPESGQVPGTREQEPIA